jgi:hypothetical protein
MTKRTFKNINDFLSNLHREGVTILNFDGRKIPCIYINPKKYDQIISETYGKKSAVDTLLNIFHSENDVFVDVEMKFLNIGLEENYLVYANDKLDFFEALSNTGLIALAPDPAFHHTTSNVFMIQLPKKHAAENALQIIKIIVATANTKKYY